MTTQTDTGDPSSLLAKVRILQGEVKQHFPVLVDARRKYARSRRDEDRAELDRVDASLAKLWDQY